MNEKLPEGSLDIPTFNGFDDQKFERVVLELIRKENKSGKAHRLGPGPVSQQGYDIEAVLDDGTNVCCECKQRAKTLDSNELTNAANCFLRGTKLSWADQFWLVTSGVRSRTSDEAERTAQYEFELLGKKFLYVPREELWERLKYQPELVFNYIGEHWGQISLAWTETRIGESREDGRRKEEKRIFSRDGVDTYEDGYLSLTFLQPDVGGWYISALFRFKTDGLDRALITLSNDDVLDAFDEPMWRDEKPLMVSEHMGKAWAQIGNVRVELTQRMFGDLAEYLRSVRQRWLETISFRDRDLEAYGYQHLPNGSVKLGRIQAGMWRSMKSFAADHDSEMGSSKWHIFDRSGAMLKVWTNETTEEMDTGYHLLLSTVPHVYDSTGAHEMIDLIWNLPFSVEQLHLPARGKRGPWGCDTAVHWLTEEFLPHLIDLDYPASEQTWMDRLVGRSSKSPTRLSVGDIFYTVKARDWSVSPILDRDSLIAMISDLQNHYALRHTAHYPATHAQAVDESLIWVLSFAVKPNLSYIANTAGIDEGEDGDDFVSQLRARTARPYSSPNGGLLELRLRAVLIAVRDDEDSRLNSAECQKVADVLRDLAKSAALYNRLVAHRSTVSNVFPV